MKYLLIGIIFGLSNFGFAKTSSTLELKFEIKKQEYSNLRKVISKLESDLNNAKMEAIYIEGQLSTLDSLINTTATLENTTQTLTK